MSWRRRLVASPLAPPALLAYRATIVARHEARRLRTSLRWLVRSREYTNFTYDLEPLNRMHLAWFVADLAGAAVEDAAWYLDELDRDESLRTHLRERTRASTWRHGADEEPAYARRAGWYALVRALRPQHVIETGTDKGLGSCVLAAALLRNGTGHLTTIDVNPHAGYLLAGRYAEVARLRLGDSVTELGSLEPADLFIHDSDHSAAHEAAELRSVRLTRRAVVLSDNAHLTDELPRWATETGQRFSYFQERPLNHWYRGAGIGAVAPGSFSPIGDRA